MTTQLTGVIHTIFNFERFGDFQKRVFWLAEPKTDKNKYPQFWALEMHHDDGLDLAHYKVGDPVCAHVEIRGRLWSKNGRESVINILKCTSIERVSPSEVMK